MARRILFGTLGVLFTLAVTLTLLEAGLRVYSRVTPNVDVEFYRYATLMKAGAEGSGVGFRHEPGTSHRLFGVDVDIDSRGFRDRAPEQEPRTRIALLGDSVTFGWGVPYGQRFSELLERAWSRPGHAVELINTGHGNWNTVQEHAALTELLAGERIEGVLQVWYINDAEVTPAHRDAPWYARFHLAIFVWAKSDLLQRRMGSKQGYVGYYRGLYEDDAPGMVAFRDALRATGTWTRERGLPWVFVILPEFHEFPGPFADVYAKVADAASRAGATVVDLTGEFEGVDPATTWVARNDVHPNARGHELIARAIARHVEPDTFRAGA